MNTFKCYISVSPPIKVQGTHSRIFGLKEVVHNTYLVVRFHFSWTECLHKLVRQEYWGYAKEENLSHEQLVGESYQGIRPAPGYPACPDHSIKPVIAECLNAQEIGVTLTESNAMSPASSICGFYFWHPEATYFNVGQIDSDQLKDYAKRSKIHREVANQNLREVITINAETSKE